MELTIKKLTDKTLDDFLLFFDTIAFCDNPDWAACYCYFFHIPEDQVWLKRTGEQNREEAIEAIKNKTLQGYLAYINNTPAGWCSTGPLENYPRLLAHPEITKNAGTQTASVVCFIIDHTKRRKGIATSLLQKACNDYAAQGYTRIEGYPKKAPKNRAGNYHGPLALYQSLGFTIQKELDDSYIVRKNFNE